MVAGARSGWKAQCDRSSAVKPSDSEMASSSGAGLGSFSGQFAPVSTHLVNTAMSPSGSFDFGGICSSVS